MMHCWKYCTIRWVCDELIC